MIRQRTRSPAKEPAKRGNRLRRLMAKSDDTPADRRPGRPSNPKLHPDTQWLKAAIDRTRKLQKEIAVRIGMKQSMFSKGLKGERPFTVFQLVGLAGEFGVSVDELVRRLGIKMTPRGVPIVGKVTPDSRVSPVVGPRKGEQVRATDAPPAAVAYIYEPDGTIFIVDPGDPGAPAVPPEVFGHPCIVETSDNVLPLLGTLGKASQRGHVTLRLYYGSGAQMTLKQEHLHSAALVIEIQRP